MSERLNKYLAFHLGLSRREADDLISQRRVCVNGDTAELGGRVEDGQTVTLNGRPVTERKNYTYLALNKPEGYVSSRKQQGDNPTLYELIPKEYHNLKTVGRLDKDSSGMLLLSDDGDFTFQMTHPKFHKVKNYEITLSKALEPLHHQMISDYGVHLDDGPSKLVLERQDDNRKKWIVTMHEGRNRQIRRTFGALGYDVPKLHRTHFGNYTLENLKPGEFKLLEPPKN